jgi:type I restriction enzyme S subunit
MSLKNKKSDNIPKLRFPNFKSEWVINTLENLTTKISDGIHATPKYNDQGDYYFINGNNLVDNKIIISNSTKRLALEEFLIHKRELNSSSILLSINGTIGNMAYYNNEKIVIGKSASYININTTISKVFIYNALQSEGVIRFFNDELTGSTIKNLSLGTIKRTRISIPLLPEQQKIAIFLTAVDDKIQQLTRKKQMFEEYKKGCMQLIFSQAIRFKDDKRKVYPDWKEKTLGEIGHFFSGGTPLTTQKNYYEGDIPFIKSGEINSEITEQSINETGLKNSSAKIVNVGDILYALYGATSGQVAISKIKGAINQAILCIRTDENNQFIYYYLHLSKGKIIQTYLQGGQGNLSGDIVKALAISIPARDEQQKIANFLSAIDNKINHTHSQLQQTQLYKKGLLQQMFI